MTCIIGLIHDGRVYMGADSMSASGWDARTTKLKKVFRLKGKFLIGYTTSFRMGQLLEHRLEVAAQNGEDDMAYMVTVFVEAVRSLLKDNGFSKVDNNKETGGQFLVGYNGRLYLVDSDFQVNEHADGFDACGCGQDYALAAMKALEDLPPRERIKRALEIVASFSNGVQGPFYTKVLK